MRWGAGPSLGIGLAYASTGDSSDYPIPDEVTAADDLRRILHAADERHGVERRIDGAAEQPLLADGGAEGVESDRGADPGQGPANAPREVNLSEP